MFPCFRPCPFGAAAFSQDAKARPSQAANESQVPLRSLRNNLPGGSGSLLVRRLGCAPGPRRETMVSTGLNALALMRFGGRGTGFFSLLVLLAVAGVLVWALNRPERNDSAKQ